MFFPYRYKGFAVYDVKVLIPSVSYFHQKLYLEGLKRLPFIFLNKDHWGEERNEGTLWIEIEKHDRYCADIRDGMAGDENFNKLISSKMKEEVENLATEVRHCLDNNSEIDHLNELLPACKNAVSWVATNWLNPKYSIRLALASLLRNDNIEEEFELISAGGHMPVFIEAWTKLEEVINGTMTISEYLSDWGPAFAAGNELGPVADEKPLMKLLKNEMKLSEEIKSLVTIHKNKIRKRSSLVSDLICKAESIYGLEQSKLLESQIQLYADILWQEERRHVLQQQVYAIVQRAKMEGRLRNLNSESQLEAWVTPELIER